MGSAGAGSTWMDNRLIGIRAGQARRFVAFLVEARASCQQMLTLDKVRGKSFTLANTGTCWPC